MVVNQIIGIVHPGAPENGGLGKTIGVTPAPAFLRRPNIREPLNFDNKLYIIFYDQGCQKCYDGYNADSEGRYHFVMALSFKVNKFSWGGYTCCILDIPSDKWDSNVNEA